jgi:hypothetical protein
MADTPSRAEALEAAKALFYSSKDGKVAAGLFVTVHDFIVGAPDAAPAGEPAAEQKATLKITLEWDDDDGPHGTLRDMHYLDARLKFLHSLERATPPRGEADERAMFEAYWSSLASDGSESETERLNAYHAGWNAWSARAALRADERAISASGETKG